MFLTCRHLVQAVNVWAIFPSGGSGILRDGAVCLHGFVKTGRESDWTRCPVILLLCLDYRCNQDVGAENSEDIDLSSVMVCALLFFYGYRRVIVSAKVEGSVAVLCVIWGLLKTTFHKLK